MNLLQSSDNQFQGIIETISESAGVYFIRDADMLTMNIQMNIEISCYYIAVPQSVQNKNDLGVK